MATKQEIETIVRAVEIELYTNFGLAAAGSPAFGMAAAIHKAAMGAASKALLLGKDGTSEPHS